MKEDLRDGIAYLYRSFLTKGPMFFFDCKYMENVAF